MLYAMTMADEPLSPEILDAFAKALRERNDKELERIQERHDREIIDFKQLYDDIIKDKLARFPAAEHEDIIKEQTLYRDQRIAEMNRETYWKLWEKKDEYPRELERYVKEYQDAQKILKEYEERSRVDSLKPDQPRR